MRDIAEEIDALDDAAGSLVDDLFSNDNEAPPGDAIAPGVELCDANRGRTDGDPGRGGVEADQLDGLELDDLTAPFEADF